MNRRSFLTTSAGCACGGLTAGVSACVGFHYVPSTTATDGVQVRKQDLGQEPFALVNAPRGDPPIYLRRNPAGGFTAVSTRCTHKGCTVEPAGDRLACPCHGSEFSNTGALLHGPAERPLVQYQVRETQDALIIVLRAAQGTT